MGKMDEMILVVPRENVFANETLTFQGVNSDGETIGKIMAHIERHFSEMRRGERRGEILHLNSRSLMLSSKEKTKYLLSSELRGGGEARLHNEAVTRLRRT